MTVNRNNAFDLIIRGDIVGDRDVIANGYIAINKGKVAAIGAGEPPSAGKIQEYPGCLLFPGLIDAQVHAGSREGIDGLYDATRSAAAGGVTTIVDMPFDEPRPVDNPTAMTAKIAKIGQLAVTDVALYVTARKGGEASELRSLTEMGACAVKLSTYEYHPVRFPRFSTAEMYEIFLVAADIGLPVAFHNEDQELVNHLTARAIKTYGRTPRAHGASRPPFVEMVANAQILELALHTGVRIHIVHSSVADGFTMVRHYRERGAKATAETCLQYFALTEDDMVKRGSFLKQNPPLRAKKERTRLWEALARDEIDLVSTDHVAWTADRKQDPDVFKNGAGVPGLEALLPIFYTGLVEHDLSPSVIARVCALNPAKHFGFYPDKGHLGIGADADVAVVKPGQGTFDQGQITSQVGWSPYHGRPTAGSVVATFLRGHQIFDRAHGFVATGGGQFLRPQAR